MSDLSSQPCTTSKSLKDRPRSPEYIFLKGSIYYFRVRFSTSDQKRMGASEIKFSLKTGILLEARRMAQKLHVHLEEFLMEGKLSLSEIKAQLTALLEGKMQNSPVKRLLPFTEIQARMHSLMLLILEQANETLYHPKSQLRYIDGIWKEATPSEVIGLNLYDLIQKIKDPSKFTLNNECELIYDLLRSNLFSIDELTSETIPQIINEYYRTLILLNKILLARENGDFTYENKFTQEGSSGLAKQKILDLPDEENSNLNYLQDNIKSNEAAIDKNSTKLNITISAFIERYKNTKLNDGDWTARNVATHLGRLNNLLFILGDIDIGDINRDFMRDFREKLRKLPPHRTSKKEYKDKTVDELIAMNLENTLNIKTINDTLEAISGMFEWAIREGLLEKNPAKGLTLKDDRQEVELRDAFTLEDLQKIFFSGVYRQENFSNPAYYWIPLIALYTGMRLEEICQLHCEDVYNEDGIWVFDIREESTDGLNDKHLKTKNAKRKIPIHDILKDIGLIDYVNKQREANNLRLFHQLNKTDKTPKYGKQISKKFASLVKQHNIDGKKSFHSLRHSFSDFFKVRNMHNDIFRQVFGHDIQELAGKQYGSKFSSKQCYDELISKLHYEGEDLLKNK